MDPVIEEIDPLEESETDVRNFRFGGIQSLKDTLHVDDRMEH